MPPIEYDTGVMVCKVQQKGEIHFRGHVFAVSRAFRSCPVGLVLTTEEGRYDVRFCHHKIRSLTYGKFTNQSVTYVAGTCVTLDTSLNKKEQRVADSWIESQRLRAEEALVTAWRRKS